MREIRYLLILVLATAATIATSHFYKVSTNNIIFFIGLIWLLPIFIRLGSDVGREEITALEDKLDKRNGERSLLTGNLENVKRERAYLEKKLTNLSRLYTVTKEMSSDIRLSELFGSLKNFLEDNFRFKKFTTVLLTRKDNQASIDKAYEIGAKSSGFVAPDKTISALTGVVAKSRKPLFLEEKDSLLKYGFDLKINNILALPLVVQKNVISVILAEDIQKEEYDKFLILAPQIALEMERVRLFDEVERLSVTDGLTGCFLRRSFLKRLKEEMERASHSKTNLSFIMADLDYFKKCNDNFGHLTGDVVLKNVAAILKKGVREIDLVARYGGEEFCILLPETSKQGAYAVGERIRKAVEDHAIKAYDESVTITISLGISSFPEDSKELAGLIEKADLALYEAKKTGRDKTCLAG
ncbi:MAG: diguanylate cyclase [Candidatus Omnitrophica bacterium]|nr:diguanylate cyclase [Candidatus Omnitrophota bacterium]